MPSATPPSWGPVAGSAPRLLMVTMIKWREANNACSRSQGDLADEVGVTADTVSLNAAKLEQWGMIRQQDTPRSAYGNFVGKRYHLRVDRVEVRELIAYYDPSDGDLFANASSPVGTPPRIFEAEAETPDGKTLSPVEIFLEPCRKIGCGAYKDSRAPSRASKIIYHSLPNDHDIDDDELIELLKQALAVCGEGTVGVPTYRLVDSLAHHIPRALEAGYDFKRDIIACIRFYTQNARKHPLNRFDVTFRDDLPKWRLERLRRTASKDPRAIAARAPRDARSAQKGDKPAETSSSPPPASDEAKHRKHINGLLSQIEIIDSGQNPGWILEKNDENSFERARHRIAATLRALGVIVADDTRPLTAGFEESLHARENGVAPTGCTYSEDDDVG